MASQLTAAHQVQRIHLGYEQGEATAWLHARGEVLADEPEGDGHVLTVRLDPADRARFERLWPASGAPTPLPPASDPPARRATGPRCCLPRHLPSRRSARPIPHWRRVARFQTDRA